MKKIDLAFVVLFPLLIFLLVFFFNLQINYIESLILVFGIPATYLSVWSRYKVRKVALISLLFSVPIAVVSELIGFGDNAWSVPKSILPYRLFGFSPIENYIWMFLVTYVILIFYEYFCNKQFQRGVSDRIKIMIYILYPLTLAVAAIFTFDSSLLALPYAYIWLGVPFLLMPVILFLAKYPKFIKSFSLVSIFFFYVSLLYELIGLKLKLWIYPSVHYIGLVSILGLKFPIEELFFVMIIGGFAACTYYEFFANRHTQNKKH